MITTEDLVDTIRYATGDTVDWTREKIYRAAERLGLAAVDDAWADDDADAICIEVLP